MYLLVAALFAGTPAAAATLEEERQLDALFEIVDGLAVENRALLPWFLSGGRDGLHFEDYRLLADASLAALEALPVSTRVGELRDLVREAITAQRDFFSDWRRALDAGEPFESQLTSEFGYHASLHRSQRKLLRTWGRLLVLLPEMAGGEGRAFHDRSEGRTYHDRLCALDLQCGGREPGVGSVWSDREPIDFGAPEPELAALLRALRDPDPHVRGGAGKALRELGPEARDAVPALIEALADPHFGVRASAAAGLGGIGADATPAIPFLAHALRDEHRFVRSWAAMALAELGPAARSAAPLLVEMMHGDHENLRGRAWCAEALRKVDAPAGLAVPALIRSLEDPSHEVRSVAVLSLEHYAKERPGSAGTALHPLADRLQDPHWNVRGNAACALGVFGADAAFATSGLEVAARDEGTYVANCAVKALAAIRDAS